MPQKFWIDEYRKKAALPDPVAQTGRGSQFQAVEFLHVVKNVIKLLDLRREHDFLNVGCANGLLDIVLSASCRSILAVEPVKEPINSSGYDPVDRVDRRFGLDVEAKRGDHFRR